MDHADIITIDLIAAKPRAQGPKRAFEIAKSNPASTLIVSPAIGAGRLLVLSSAA
jgi:hypothetical protein